MLYYNNCPPWFEAASGPPFHADATAAPAPSPRPRPSVGFVGALKPLAGRIERGELAAQDIAYLPQAAEIDRSFPISVYDLVAMGLWRRTGVLGGIGAKARQSIEQAIAAVGLTGFEGRAIAT